MRQTNQTIRNKNSKMTRGKRSFCQCHKRKYPLLRKRRKEARDIKQVDGIRKRFV